MGRLGGEKTSVGDALFNRILGIAELAVALYVGLGVYVRGRRDKRLDDIEKKGEENAGALDYIQGYLASRFPGYRAYRSL
jgi:hypothetical protein